MKIFQLRELFYCLVTRFSIFILSYAIVILCFNYELNSVNDENLLLYKLEDSSSEIYNFESSKDKNELSDSVSLITHSKVNNKFAINKILLSALVHAQSLQFKGKSFLYTCSEFLNKCYRLLRSSKKLVT